MLPKPRPLVQMLASMSWNFYFYAPISAFGDCSQALLLCKICRILELHFTSPDVGVMGPPPSSEASFRVVLIPLGDVMLLSKDVIKAATVVDFCPSGVLLVARVVNRVAGFC